MQVRGPHQGRYVRRFLCRQQADRLRIPGQDHQAVEHPGPVQVHHPGQS